MENLQQVVKNHPYFELLKKKEDLHPDLIPYLEKDKKLGIILKHPLVFELFYNEIFNARINLQYLHKLKYIEEKTEQKEWSSIIWMYERPYRMERFLQLQDNLSDKEYWEILSSIWSDSENLWQYKIILNNLFKKDRSGKENLMNKEERKFLESLPESFTIYRGHQGKNRLGWSWSLSYFKAKWFSERFSPKKSGLLRATINKKDAIAFINGRSEYEIIADPKNLTDIKTILPIKRDKELQIILDEARSNFTLKNSFHGVWHWEKVERNAILLANRTKGADRKVARIFAIIHDSKRENEEDDPEHGIRASNWVKLLYKKGKLRITEVQKELLIYACQYHNTNQTSENPTIGVCWDSDRLDLTRVGITPDPKLLSTIAGKEMIWNLK